MSKISRASLFGKAHHYRYKFIREKCTWPAAQVSIIKESALSALHRAFGQETKRDAAYISAINAVNAIPTSRDCILSSVERVRSEKRL